MSEHEASNDNALLLYKEDLPFDSQDEFLTKRRCMLLMAQDKVWGDTLEKDKNTCEFTLWNHRKQDTFYSIH